ncbi:MAG: hypothetical protein L0Z07_02845, partial [Planctomycetes bacterium]|nr:hypothetical protein [Planctomycetota bacterium]
MVPLANATADPDGRRITVIALSDEHDKIAEVLAEIKQETPPRVEPVLHLYDLSTEERGKLTLILDAMAIDLPGIRRVPDDKSGALSIFASEEQHAEIAAIIAQLRQDLSAETRYSLVAYPIKVAEAASILATLQPLIPDARLTVDPASNSLVAWARPKDHQQIADAIKKIDSDAPVERRLQLMRHEVDKAEMSIALQVLQSLYPGVRFVVDSNAKIIYAWANGRDQKAIDETLARMQPDVPEKDRPTLVAYPLRKADPNNIQQILSRAVPTAQVVADTGNNQVIIWATPEEHGEIKKTIAELNQGSTDGMKFVVYPTGSVPVSVVSGLLQSLLPRARVVANPDTNHLAVWATEDDHAIVVSTIKEITDAAAADGRKLVTYPIDYASYSPVVNLMSNVIPNARMYYDSNSGQLFVWATDTDQATARAAMEKMALDEANARTMKIYPVNAEASSYATTLLSSVAPLARYVWDTQHGRLLVWGTAREHEQLTDSFANAVTDESIAMNLVIYSIDPDTISSIISVLSTVVPQARVVQDTRGSRLMIWATASDHEKVASTVSQLEKTEGGDLQLVVYPVGQEASSYVSTLLYSVAPQARSSWDTQHGRVLVWATPQEHQQLSEAFAKVATDEESETSLVVYPADSAMTPSLTTLASSIAPQARVTPDSRTGSLMIWATKTDHAKLADAFSKVSSTATDDMRFVVYSVDSALVGSLNGMIYGIAPQAKVVPDYQTGSLLIWASQRDHDTIGKTLESAGTASARARKLTVYAVEAGQSSSLVSLLSGMVPQARVTYDTHGGNLLVWASEQDQAAVVEAMEKMGQSQEAGRNLIVYPLEGADAQSLMSVLYTVVPQARFIPDPQSGNLLAWGTQAEQQHISDAIQKVRQSGGERALKIYPLSGRSSASLSQLMQSVVPQARIVVDNQNGTVLAWASPADHAKIAQSITEIDAEQAQGGQPEVRVYEVLTSDPYAVLSSLQTMFAGRPDVRFSLDSKTNRIIAWGGEADQERARDVLSKFEEGAPTTSQMQLEVYDLGTANPQTVIQAIKPLIKETRGTELIPDAANRQLIALALPAQQATIRTTIEQMQAEEKSLDVLQLSRLDTFTAEDAIRSLFVKEPVPPTVDADYANGRLMVRGTEKQVEEIRQLLFKMGETDLAATQRTGRRNMRVISVEGNVDRTLKEMEKVWPQMRGNPIRVVKPSAMFPTLRSSREKEGNDPSATPD